MYQASRISQSNNETGSTLARPAQHKTLRWATLPEDVFKFMEVRSASNSAAYLLPTIQKLKE